MSCILTEKNGPVGIITFNRPEVLNALNYDVMRELAKALNDMGQDDSIFAVILTGSGRSFVAGADIAFQKDFNAIEAKEWCLTGYRTLEAIENFRKPVIAAINGFALGGGCEIAAACDIRIASNKAKIGLPEVNLGITPGFGGTQRLARIIGPSKTKELVFTGKFINAEEAHAIGLINKVVSHETLMDEAIAMVTTIAEKGQFAVRQAKLEINKGMQCDITTALAFEIESCCLCFATDDKTEGMAAFVEKRKPNFIDCRPKIVK